MSNAESQVVVPPGRIAHIPALDGIRGIALPGIILFHYTLFMRTATSPSWFNHVGSLVMCLQMFFVLSGALITSLLVSEHQRTGTVSFKSFYNRRSRRLGPALMVLLPLMIVVELCWTGNRADSPLGIHPWFPVVMVAFFIGNWADYTHLGGLGWFGPAWSLGVEEQFYLTWPIVLVLCMRRGVRRVTLLVAMAGVLILSLGVAELLFRRYGYTRTYVATPTQFPCILLGCAVGYEITANPTGRVVQILRHRLVGLIGLVGVFVAAVEVSIHSHYILRGGYVPFGLFGAVLVGHCFVTTDRPWALTRVIGWKPFEISGKVSYEAYLIHVIVISAMLQVFPHLGPYPAIAIDSVIVALASCAIYYYVEQPIRRRGWRTYFARA
ncbi:MAG TPA: acyltransferase [Mycobacteriales bacterium]|nr:acyltransferase [Mycobacteriales bacterium]